ncbi:uncharacterized protein [Periplaneta americana]|uniref:uncharacterized protein n=1 Tax=Periplaneta americana TaxID=6978 RepID=UPI0037E8AAD9
MRAFAFLVSLTFALVARADFSGDDAHFVQNLLFGSSDVDKDAVSLDTEDEVLLPSLAEDVQKFASRSRIVRESHHNRYHGPTKCCEPHSDEARFSPEILEIYRDCQDEAAKEEEKDNDKQDEKDHDKEEERKKHKTCLRDCRISACIARRKGVLDENGYVIEAELTKLVEECYIHDDSKAKAKAAVPECTAESNKKAKAKMQKEKKCNPAGIIAYECIKREMILSCPEDKKVKNKACDDLRKNLEEEKKKGN